jgi:hypothetical protein
MNMNRWMAGKGGEIRITDRAWDGRKPTKSLKQKKMMRNGNSSHILSTEQSNSDKQTGERATKAPPKSLRRRRSANKSQENQNMFNTIRVKRIQRHNADLPASLGEKEEDSWVPWHRQPGKLFIDEIGISVWLFGVKALVVVIRSSSFAFFFLASVTHCSGRLHRGGERRERNQVLVKHEKVNDAEQTAKQTRKEKKKAQNVVSGKSLRADKVQWAALVSRLAANKLSRKTR